MGSLTPGHPERGLTKGVEATTGPLGQGVGNAVGMAVSECILRNRFGEDVINHYTYCLHGDGDIQEPISQGAIAMAGHWGLGKLINYYGSNNAQISGKVSRSDSTNYVKMYEAHGWHVQEIDGHNKDEIRSAIRQAQMEIHKPSVIIGNTIMAKGCANMEGDHNTHGAPLPPEEIAVLLTDIGLEIEGIKEVESIKGGLKGIVIGKILTKVQHPNADRLSLTTVDIGRDKVIQIVCGAPNVDVGQKVPIATVGTWLYDGDNKFKIKRG